MVVAKGELVEGIEIGDYAGVKVGADNRSPGKPQRMLIIWSSSG